MASAASRLKLYDVALDVATALDKIAADLPKERAYLQDQLRRAAASIVLNLAEGAEEFKPLEKARFYRFARRSASECLAVLDLAERLVGPSIPTSSERERLVSFVVQVRALIRAVEERD